MARAMFEYTKEVLHKVSFDVALFIREIEKATRILLPHEIIELRNFVQDLTHINPHLESSLHFLDVWMFDNFSIAG